MSSIITLNTKQQDQLNKLAKQRRLWSFGSGLFLATSFSSITVLNVVAPDFSIPAGSPDSGLTVGFLLMTGVCLQAILLTWIYTRKANTFSKLESEIRKDVNL